MSTTQQPARPREYYPPDLLLEELTQLWPRIPPRLQAYLLELARQFAG
ncbi:MAG: hypothetical protein NZU63_14850 [Gemmataceae bacterium]|nr:hypothetical protein [Gemmataceae bacterium]